MSRAIEALTEQLEALAEAFDTLNERLSDQARAIDELTTVNNKMLKELACQNSPMSRQTNNKW